jgi:hypothetical protein
LNEQDLLATVSENTGVPVRLIRVAVGYWAARTSALGRISGVARRLLLDEMLPAMIAEQLCAVMNALSALLASDNGVPARQVVFLR